MTTPTLPTDGFTACLRYNEVRPRLVSASFNGPPTAQCRVNNLADLREQIDVFVLDGFGVLNVGDQAIVDAPQRVAQLRALGAQVFVLTNGATMNTEAMLEKYEQLGFDFTANDVVSSRMALARYLRSASLVRRWGFAATNGSEIDEIAGDSLLLHDDPMDYDNAMGFVLLSANDWNAHRQHLLLKSLARTPRPVLVGNPDLVAPREDALSLEPGYYAHQIADTTGRLPQFFGKPFQNVFDLVSERIGPCPPHRIAMVGDSLHTDILGGAAAGWRTVLVSDHD